jgi:hypothetical protein
MIAKPSRRQIAQIESIPAPIGGLNARDAIAAMPETDAVVLDNMYPTPSAVVTRNGELLANTIAGVSGNVLTLAQFSPSSGSRKLFAAANNGSWYDCSSAGSQPQVFTGATLDYWQTRNFGAGGGQYLVCVNGTDSMLLYNGSGWQTVGNGTGAAISSASAASTTCTITTATAHGVATGCTVTVVGATPAAYNVSNAVITVTGATTFTYVAGSAPGGVMTVLGTYTYSPSVTGVATSAWVNLCVYSNRLFFIQKNSMLAWYLPALSIGGAATYLDMSTLTRLGGYLVAAVPWTIETTSGMTQMIAFVTSEGEVVVFQGNDPSLAATWYEVGTFRIGRPVGYRCDMKIGSDVAIMCADGLIPLSEAMLTDRSQKAIAVSDKIRNLINNDVVSFGGLQGWQPILYPFGNKVVLNVPAASNAYQYVMNTLNRSWCRFTGWSTATCFETVGDLLYYGGSNGGIAAVYQCDIGASDAGAPINCAAVQAPNYFGSHTNKEFTMARPLLQSNAPITPSFQINTDFNTLAPSNVFSFVVATGTPWGSPWFSPWSSAFATYKNWINAPGIGFCGSPSMAFATTGATVTWQATDVAYIPGGPQ